MNIPENDRKNIIKSWPVYVFLLLVLSSSLWAIYQRRQRRLAQGGTGAAAISIWGEEEAVSSPIFVAPEADRRVAIQNLINNRQGWDPVGMNWYGKEAEDFDFRSIYDEKIRKLSDYRGKDVIVVFWATWCPPCKAEIPHLKKLREDISPDKLEIIAISNENTSLIKQFVESNDINYTTSGITSRPPAPFSYVESIPTSFYINEQGKVELIVVGVVSAETAKEILAVSESQI